MGGRPWAEAESARATQPRVRRLLLLSALLIAASCSSGGGDKAEEPATTTSPEPVVSSTTTTTCPPVAAPTAGMPASVDPYVAVGARQIPGPATTTTTIPAAPVSIVLVPPPNPDSIVAAVQPDGVPLTVPDAAPSPATAPPGCGDPGNPTGAAVGDDGP